MRNNTNRGGGPRKGYRKGAPFQRPEKVSAVISMSIDKPTKDFLLLLAQDNHITLSELCRRLMDESLRRRWPDYEKTIRMNSSELFTGRFRIVKERQG